MDITKFKNACKKDFAEIIGDSKYDEDKVEDWKSSVIESISKHLEVSLPQDKVFKTGTDVTVIMGPNYGFDKTSTMLMSPQDDYMITFWHQNSEKVLILVTVVA